MSVPDILNLGLVPNVIMLHTHVHTHIQPCGTCENAINIYDVESVDCINNTYSYNIIAMKNKL